MKFSAGTVVVSLGLICSLWAGAVQAKSIALLVGISEYAGNNALEGPVNDVEAIRDVLTQNWGFEAANIKTLLNREATHANIVRELSALKQRSAPGDVVFVYFSGHGTSALDTEMNLPLPHTSGAFIPIDIPSGAVLSKLAREGRLADALIVGRAHLRPVFDELDKDRKVFMVADSCFSGNLSRAIQSGNQRMKFRYMPIVLEDGGLSGGAVSKQSTAVEPYPYRQVVFLSAASDSEKARDLGLSDMAMSPTRDGKPHGAMTDALLRVLWGEVAADANGDGKLNYSEVYRATLQYMETRAYGHTPQRLPGVADDTGNSAAALMFGKGEPARGLSRPTSSVAVRVKVAAELGEVMKSLQVVPSIALVGVSQPTDLELVKVSGGVQLRSGSGDPILTQPSFNEVMLRRIEADSWWRGLVVDSQGGFAVQVATFPESKGNTFRENDEFKFVVKPERAASVVILNINSEGKVSVLYPGNPAESKLSVANQVIGLPSGASNIVVTPPFGLDQVLVLALAEPLTNWHGINDKVSEVGIQSAPMQGLRQLINEQRGKLAWQALSVRTYPKTPK